MTKFPYKHIMWDWNGTLLNDSHMAVMVINQTLAKRDMPTIDHERYQQIFGFPVIDYYRRLGFDLWMNPLRLLAQNLLMAMKNISLKWICIQVCERF